MVTSSVHVHARDKFIRHKRGGVFSVFQGADQYGMNESCEISCALNRRICGDMLLWGSAQLKDVSIVRKDTNFYTLMAVPPDEHNSDVIFVEVKASGGYNFRLENQLLRLEV
jgi:hypothetical protein